MIDSTITCPVCGFTKSETMPTDACQVRYQCPQSLPRVLGIISKLTYAHRSSLAGACNQILAQS